VVAPPSRVAKGNYQFIQGSLDDLASLPTLNDAPTLIPTATDLNHMRDGSGRNDALFKLLGRAVRSCDDFDQLLDYAQTQNAQCFSNVYDAAAMPWHHPIVDCAEVFGTLR
jgi:hypothetical protein